MRYIIIYSSTCIILHIVYYQNRDCVFIMYGSEACHVISNGLIFFFQIPCKHVFCLSCAKREDKVCPRCLEKVTRVEQTGLGTVFMCTHGGTRYGNAGCRRTYLSQRDLQVIKIECNIEMTLFLLTGVRSKRGCLKH